ncbi:geranylgeranyl reductase [Chitinispirillum alkaliphilum]|nr:geranylgeranyl reductase [Chitinispirillum alkaliphilum]
MNNSHKPSVYDIIIIGAGPAGLKAGLTVTENSGLKVLVTDKIVPWDKPIPCAEGVGRLGLERSLEVRPAWIRQVISKACFHAPNNTTVTYQDKNKGYIIDRARMQKDLYETISSRGGEFIFGKKVIGVESSLNGHRLIHFDDTTSLKARVVIDASGPVGLLGRKEQICWKPYDLESACFVVAENVDIPQDTVHIQAGSSIAPGGYAWIFPRGENRANIGVVVGGKFRNGVNIRDLLDQHLKTNFPDAKVITTFAGSISCGYQRKTIALPGFIKAGDAASAVNPISRAGISEALLSGDLAGTSAIEMLKTSQENKQRQICRKYEKMWYKELGRRHLKLAKVKASLYSVPDEDYNKAAATLQSLSLEEITMSKIFKVSLGRFPRLVWALRHLM